MTGTRIITVAVATGLLAFGGACGKGRSGTALSVSARAVTTASSSTVSGSLDLGAGISLDRVRVAVREIRLEGAMDPGGTASSATADAAAGDGEGGDAGEARVGPFLVDLTGAALAHGTLTQAFDAEVPPGTYRELRIVVGPVDVSMTGSNAGLAALAEDSVVIDGSIGGAAFTFSSSLTSDQKRESTVVVAAGGTSGNVTLTVSPEGWFKAPDGSPLDPRVDANRAAIEANIRASIDAFGDDDEDGLDDGGGRKAAPGVPPVRGAAGR